MKAQQARALVYLDHSRFSKISSALDLSVDMGNAEQDRASYREIYDLLLDLVRAGRVVVPVSYWHICETVRWPADKRKAQAGYCSVVDALSQGIAIRFWTDAYSMLLRGDLMEPTGVVLDCFPAHHRADLARVAAGEGLTFARAVEICAASGLSIVENFMRQQVNEFQSYVSRIQDGKSVRVLPAKTNGEPPSFEELVCNEALLFMGTIAKIAQPGYDPELVLLNEQQDQSVLLGAGQCMADFFGCGLSEIVRMPPRKLLQRLGAIAGFSAVVCGVAESGVTAKKLRRSPQNIFDLLHMSYLGLCKYFFMEAKFTKYGAKAASCVDTFLESQPQKFLDKLRADFKL